MTTTQHRPKYQLTFQEIASKLKLVDIRQVCQSLKLPASGRKQDLLVQLSNLYSTKSWILRALLQKYRETVLNESNILCCQPQSRGPVSLLACSQCFGALHAECVREMKLPLQPLLCVECILSNMDPFHSSLCFGLGLNWPISGHHIFINMPLTPKDSLNKCCSFYLDTIHFAAHTNIDPAGSHTRSFAVRCIQAGSVSGLPKEVTQVVVNGSPIRRIRGVAPVDISYFVKKGTNTLVVELDGKAAKAATAAPIVLVVDVLANWSQDQVFQRVSQGTYLTQPTEVECRETGIQLVSRDIDGDLVVHDSSDPMHVPHLQISFKCPISLQRIQSPARSQLCKHFQCFDALTHISTSFRQLKWCCPVCGGPADPTSLVIDPYFASLMRSFPTEPSAWIVQGASEWSAVPPVPQTSKRAKYDNALTVDGTPTTPPATLVAPVSLASHAWPTPSTAFSASATTSTATATSASCQPVGVSDTTEQPPVTPAITGQVSSLPASVHHSTHTHTHSHAHAHTHSSLAPASSQGSFNDPIVLEDD